MGSLSGSASGQSPTPSNASQNPFAKLAQGGMMGIGQGLQNFGNQQQSLDQPRMATPIYPQQQPQMSPEFWKMFYGQGGQ